MMDLRTQMIAVVGSGFAQVGMLSAQAVDSIPTVVQGIAAAAAIAMAVILVRA